MSVFPFKIFPSIENIRLPIISEEAICSVKTKDDWTVEDTIFISISFVCNKEFFDNNIVDPGEVGEDEIEEIDSIIIVEGNGFNIEEGSIRVEGYFIKVEGDSIALDGESFNVEVDSINVEGGDIIVDGEYIDVEVKDINAE